MTTPAARRAAAFLMDSGLIDNPKRRLAGLRLFSIDEVAKMLDAQTGLPDLVAACESTLLMLNDEGQSISESLQAYGIKTINIQREVLATAIAEAKGET